MERIEIVKGMAKVLVDYTKKNRITASTAILTDYAEQLYEAGYVMQREGEWIYEEYDTARCSECGNQEPAHSVSPYCPNCGAKMEGGE